MPTLSPIRLIISGTDKFSSTFKKVEDKVASVGKATTKVGKAFSLGVTAPVVGFLALGTKNAMTFNNELSKLGKLDVDLPTINKFKSSIQDTALALGQDTDTLADGLYNVISAFGESTETIGQFNQVATTAKAGSISAAESLEFLSSVTKGYGDTSAEAQKKASDLGFTTEKLGQTTFGELGVSMQQVTASAVALGVKQEELFAMFATGTGVIGNTAIASTKFKALMTTLVKPTADVAKAFGGLSGQQMIAQHGFQGTVKVLKSYADKHNKAFAQMFGSTEAFSAASLLADTHVEAFSKNLHELTTSSSGATERAFNAMTTGLNETKFQADKTAAAFKVLSQDVGQELLPVLTELLRDFVIPGLRWFRSLDGETKKWIISIAGVGAVIGPLLIGIGSLLGALPALVAVVAFLISPIGLVIAGIGLLIGLFAALYLKTGSVTGMFKGFGTILLKSLLTPFNLVITAVEKLLGLVAKIPGLGFFNHIGKFLGSSRDFINEKVTGSTALTSIGHFQSLGVDKNLVQSNSSTTKKDELIVTLKNNTTNEVSTVSKTKDLKLKTDSTPTMERTF